MAVALAAVTGCSSFEKRWREAVAKAPTHPVLGPWEGSWRSDVNGHAGRLRLIVSADAASATGDRADFTYRASWSALQGTFETKQPLTFQRNGGWTSEGDWELPAWAGGLYRYRMEGSRDAVQATFRARRDYGTFSFRRPEVPVYHPRPAAGGAGR